MLRLQCIRDGCENGIELHDEHADLDYEEDAVFVTCSCGAPMLMDTEDLDEPTAEEILNTLVGTGKYHEKARAALPPSEEIAFP